MKRISAVLAAAVSAALAFAAPALAQVYPPYPPQPGGDGSTTGTGGGGDLAFTGADISVWMLVAAGLLAAGIVALVLGRRRVTAQTR